MDFPMDKDKTKSDNNRDFTESSNMRDNNDTGESSNAGKRPAEFHVFRFSFGDGVGYTSTVRMDDELGQSTGESSTADGIDVAISETTDVAESMVGSPPVAEVEGFNPSPSYVHHSHSFNKLISDTAAQHMLVQKAKDKLNRKKTALAIKSLHTSLTSDNSISFEEAMKTAAENAAIETESELRSYEELKLSRDAAEYIAEEYFGQYLFNEELAFVEESIRQRKGE